MLREGVSFISYRKNKNIKKDIHIFPFEGKVCGSFTSLHRLMESSLMVLHAFVYLILCITGLYNIIEDIKKEGKKNERERKYNFWRKIMAVASFHLKVSSLRRLRFAGHTFAFSLEYWYHLFISALMRDNFLIIIVIMIVTFDTINMEPRGLLCAANSYIVPN